MAAKIPKEMSVRAASILDNLIQIPSIECAASLYSCLNQNEVTSSQIIERIREIRPLQMLDVVASALVGADVLSDIDVKMIKSQYEANQQVKKEILDKHAEDQLVQFIQIVNNHDTQVEKNLVDIKESKDEIKRATSSSPSASLSSSSSLDVNYGTPLSQWTRKMLQLKKDNPEYFANQRKFWNSVSWRCHASNWNEYYKHFERAGLLTSDYVQVLLDEQCVKDAKKAKYQEEEKIKEQKKKLLEEKRQVDEEVRKQLIKKNFAEWLKRPISTETFGDTLLSRMFLSNNDQHSKKEIQREDNYKIKNMIYDDYMYQGKASKNPSMLDNLTVDQVITTVLNL